MARILFRRALLWTGVFLLSLGVLPTAGGSGAGVIVPNAVAGDSSPSSDWNARVTEEIGRSEYHFSQREDGAWSAPNRSHSLRTRLDESGVRVTSRTKGADSQDGGWELQIVLSAHGREGSLSASAVSPALLGVEQGRAEFQRGLITEWYLNDENGLEQGFTLDAPPDGPAEAPVILEMTLGGDLSAYLSEDDQSVLFKTAAGEAVLRYAGLKVDDARGSQLEAWLAVLPGRLQIRINDEGAVYPLTVDPLMTSPAWTAESNQKSSEFGHSTATAGDVNGDGFSDVIVGAYWYDNGQTNEGSVFVWYGGPGGLGANGTPTNANWKAESDQQNGYFGLSVATAGDVNGDGFSDIIVGAYGLDNPEVDEGRAFVWYGGAGGLGANGTPLNADWTAESNQAGAQFGIWVSTAGDVNGDGFSDVIVGANAFDYPEQNEGRAFVWYGGPGGLGPNGTPVNAAWTAESNQANAQLGYPVGTAGDVNGDGFSDVIVGARYFDNGQTDEGRVFVWYGSASGLGANGTPLNADWTAESDQAGSSFGVSAATAGDVNGDGFSDVIVGAYWYDSPDADEGRAFLWYGGPGGLGANGTPLNADWTAESNQAGARFGIPVATAGDVNGDGFSDVIVGAHNFDNGQTDEGRVFVWYGGAGGLGPNGTPSNADWSAEGNQSSAGMGSDSGAATAGDVNGDGFSDVIVGAPGFDSPTIDEGRAYVFYGSASGLATSSAWTDEGNQASARFGISVATAGDVNGDGFSDVIVGAYWYDNGQTDEGRAFVYLGSGSGIASSPTWTAESNQASAFFGTSVATAGDVNGDGFSDVIVGASQFDNDQTDEGRAFVYHGSASGLATSPAWTAESNQAYAAFFGLSVATVGDVNGDGFSDVIVGASQFDNGQTDEGRAFVYHGSGSGLATLPAWTAESNQAYAFFGESVATAGDVNGDGFSDVIVAARLFDNVQTDEGRAFVYHGSASGLATSPAWTAESDQGGAQLGSLVATAGDVNGDGFSDVIVGAYLFDNGQTDEGRAFVYHGSSSGLATTPVWTAESNQVNASFGYSVATAGDVNGDGFSDVIVGAVQFDNGQTDEGRAFVYHGSSSGLATAPTWTTESNQVNALFGNSVATAGDVNGDGFSDVIVGAYWYDNGQTDEGRAFVYYGNGGPGLSRLPNQARSDGLAPIALLGKSDASDAFRLRADGRTPAGRGEVRLQWEVKPLGTPFNGMGLGQGSLFDTGIPGSGGSAVSLEETVGGLSSGTVYKWRLRTISGNAFFPSSPWVSLPYNNRTETDLRTGP